MPRALENALSDLVLGNEIDPQSRQQAREWLERHQVPDDDADYLLEAGLDRLLVYRRLVRATLEGAIRLGIPRTHARLGGRFGHYFDRFLAERGPLTHYLRDVTLEFLNFCREPWRADPLVDDYLIDLARHESLRIEVASDPGLPNGTPVAPLELGRGVRFSPALRLERYDYAVHELPADESDQTYPEKRAAYLLVYRNAQHEVRYLETTPAAASIIAHLLVGETLESAVVAGARDQELLPDQSVLEGTARLLADLADRGALIGPAC